MIIYAQTIDEMLDIILGLVKRGLTFTCEGHGPGYKITLTGGY